MVRGAHPTSNHVSIKGRVRRFDDSLLICGDGGTVLHIQGNRVRLEAGIKQELYGLWGQDSQRLLAVGGSVYAVGSGGVVLKRD